MLCMHLLYTQYATYFSHSHYIKGEYITHSHRFTPEHNEETPLQSHEHTADELTFLSQVSNTTSTVAKETFATLLLMQTRNDIWAKKVAAAAKQVATQPNNNRAPPTLSA